MTYVFEDEASDVSPSRRYVTVCRSPGDAHYYRSFVIPEDRDDRPNTAIYASWYFLNCINLSACIEGSYSLEKFQQLVSKDTFAQIVEVA